MKIYLIRHGIAEDYATNDFQRHLTVEGRIQLNHRFQRLAPLISDRDPLKIYSSPLFRGVETTKILCHHLKRHYEVVDFLAGCSTEELLGHLDPMMNYILVGHQPYLSQYILDMTGTFIPVSRGSIHCIEWTNEKGEYIPLP